MADYKIAYYGGFKDATDVVEVVRCKDCKHLYEGDVKFVQHCVLTGLQIDYDDFCSYGEKN